ncbi:uncharacterized protein LOC144349572 [Saccoglossus kowalevskii]
MIILLLSVILQLSVTQGAPESHADHNIAVRAVTEAPSPCSLLECVDATTCFGTSFCICPTNYHWLVGTELCIDIDECVEDPTACVNAHTCVNTGGSFECGCNEGWTLSPEQICEDIDECVTPANNCQHTCNNTIGSFECLCDTGYELLPDGFSCSQNEVSWVKVTLCQMYSVRTVADVTLGDAEQGCLDDGFALLSIQSARTGEYLDTFLQQTASDLSSYWTTAQCPGDPNGGDAPNTKKDGYICKV